MHEKAVSDVHAHILPAIYVEAMREALKAAGKTGSRIDIFPDAQHGFFADYRPSYSEKDAKEAWNRCLSWFKQHGLAPA